MKKLKINIQKKILLIASENYSLKKFSRENRIDEIDKIKEGWTCVNEDVIKKEINQQTKFLFIDDIYTTGTTQFAIIEFISQTFKAQIGDDFKRGYTDQNDKNKEHINFDRVKGLIFARTTPDQQRKKHINFNEEELSTRLASLL